MSSLFPPWLVAVHGGPISGGLSDVSGEPHLGFFGTGLPRLLLCHRVAFLPAMLQAQPCAFLEICLIYANGSQKVQLKSSFSSWEQPGTTAV